MEKDSFTVMLMQRWYWFLKLRDAWHGALKDIKTKTTRTSLDRWTKGLWCHQEDLHNLSSKKTNGCNWIFRRSMKSMFQRIKQQGNMRFLQVDMAESPMVAHAEILDSKQCWSETTIAPLFGLQLRRMSTRWKGNFINFLVELYFCICFVLDAGVNPRRRVSNQVMTRWRRWTWCQ
jgi:hypothetical protein